MKKLGIMAMIAYLVVAYSGLTLPVQGEPLRDGIVTIDEALTVANNHIAWIIHNEGSWGGFDNADVAEIQEFKRGDKVLGYFCRVEPTGYIVVSLLKVLPPVKVYSTTDSIDPGYDEGMTDLIKMTMERMLGEIEIRTGSIESVQVQDVQDILETNYLADWRELGQDTVVFRQALSSGNVPMNYQGGDWLLSTDWHQEPPFNDDCEDHDCSWPQYGYYNDRAPVGCVATAAAQIMKYWAWPPFGEGSDEGVDFSDQYDWVNMLEEYVYDAGQNRFEDNAGNPCSQAQIDAVAELCYEVGAGADMWYTCDWSWANLGDELGDDMTDAYKAFFRYNPNTDYEKRIMHTDDGWWDIITTNLNLNRPIQYGWLELPEGGHSAVIDGWKIEGSSRKVHINYGWVGSAADTWYDIDNISGVEVMIRKIKPAPSLGASLSGSYSPPSFPYRYFDQDATGDDVVFEAGHLLQFLPGVKVTCTSTSGGKIAFGGESTDNTLLFSRGDEWRGIRLYDGHIYLYQNGSIVLH